MSSLFTSSKATKFMKFHALASNQPKIQKSKIVLLEKARNTIFLEFRESRFLILGIKSLIQSIEKQRKNFSIQGGVVCSTLIQNRHIRLQRKTEFKIHRKRCLSVSECLLNVRLLGNGYFNSGG